MDSGFVVSGITRVAEEEDDKKPGGGGCDAGFGVTGLTIFALGIALAMKTRKVTKNGKRQN
jgi:hypothetical protein